MVCSSAARQSPDQQGRWAIDDEHYYQCFPLTPVSVAALTPAEPARPVYKTTSEALQRDYQASPEGLTQKIGGAVIGKQAEREQERLAEMAEADQPKPCRKVAQLRVGAACVKPVDVCEIPQR